MGSEANSAFRPRRAVPAIGSYPFTLLEVAELAGHHLAETDLRKVPGVFGVPWHEPFWLGEHAMHPLER